MARVPVGLEMIALSRPLLELTLRRRVAALPGVTIHGEVAVGGLAGSAGHVNGVVLDDGQAVPADLVVDCTGRGSRSGRWLAALGCSVPAEADVKIGVGYASRLLRRKPGDLPEGVVMAVLPTPPHERWMGMAVQVEDDRWLVGLGGWHGACPSADVDEFHQHARSLPYPGIADLLDQAEPLTDIAVHQFPSSRRRLFERARTLPAGFVATGDAIASFNPIYAQGMTVAALQAQALGRVLDRHANIRASTVRAYFRAAAAVIATPWQISAGADFLYPQTTGPKPPGVDALNRYITSVQRAAQVDDQVRRAFLRVQHLLAPPVTLLTPAMIFRVLRASHGLGRSSGR